MESSTLYTIGTALNRARDNGLTVEILIEGQWLVGRVTAVDGHGVLLVSEEHDHAIARISQVAAVRVHSPAPRTQVTVDAYAVATAPSASGAYG
jgi:sRNA-binding regulator protein Hfq